MKRSVKKDKSSNEIINEAGKSEISWLKHLVFVINNAVAWIWKILHGWYQAIDALDKKIYEKSEERRERKWKGTRWWLTKFVWRNLIKILMIWWLAWYWTYELTKGESTKDENKETIEAAEWTYLNKFWNDDKVFIIDVSEYNELNEWKFKEWNEWLRENPKNKEDVRGVSWIYIRVQKEWGADEDFKKFYEWIKRFNEQAEPGQHIAVWWYIYFNKAKSAITDDWIKKQVNDAISRLEIINDDTDWVVDLVPMLDFEFTNNPWVNSERWKNCKEAVLKRLQLFKQKTWIVPWIYTWWSIYHDYFLNDSRFAKYPVRIATYNGKRVDQSPDWHSVLIWPMNNPATFQPHLVQFTEWIRWSWFWTEWRWKGFLDGSSTTKDMFMQLIIQNSDAPTDLEEQITEDIEYTDVTDKTENSGNNN